MIALSEIRKLSLPDHGNGPLIIFQNIQKSFVIAVSDQTFDAVWWRKVECQIVGPVAGRP